MNPFRVPSSNPYKEQYNMKTKILAGLAMAAVLLIGQPAFAKTTRRAVARHAVSHVHSVASRGRSFARAQTVAAAPRTFTRPVAVNHTQVRHSTAIVSRNTSTTFARNNFVSHTSRGNVAFGGAAHGGNGFHGNYAFASRDGWDHGRPYFWHGHHYRWNNGGWFIVDAFPYEYSYGPDYNGGNYGAYYGSNVGVQVQQALEQAGYYQGPIDGIVGPGTSAAIAAYQRDNGLAVTGTVTNGLLANLGIG
jgi:hypothetical protein